MLTGHDLDTKHSLDGALVQISLPSQTQTSRQIAWVNVICVTSTQKSTRKKNTLTPVNFWEFSLIFSHYYHVKGGRKNSRKWDAKKLSSAGFAKLKWSLLPIRSVSLAGVKLSEVCTVRIMRKKKKHRQIKIQIDWEIKTQSDTEATAVQHSKMTSLVYSDGRRWHPQSTACMLGPNLKNISCIYMQKMLLMEIKCIYIYNTAFCKIYPF